VGVFIRLYGIQITDCSTNITGLGRLITEELNKVRILDSLKTNSIVGGVSANYFRTALAAYPSI
jgi:hypothetical protein